MAYNNGTVIVFGHETKNKDIWVPEVDISVDVMKVSKFVEDLRPEAKRSNKYHKELGC